jgi:O-antigen/teichoic acid export membrane protein
VRPRLVRERTAISASGDRPDDSVAARPSSVIRFAAIFGSALVVGQAAQFTWLIAGSRAMSRNAFGTVLAAQVLYGALQLVVDPGTAFYGARRAAAGLLDDAARAAIIRLRLQIAFAAAVVALIVGAGGGGLSAAATAPFAMALLFYAALNYWERFGLGDSRPWSAYVIGRSLGPAVAAGVAVLVDIRLPVFVLGLVECAIIAAVGASFRLGLWRSARLARRGKRGPWRSVAAISLPVVLGQLGLASGPVLLNVTGAARAAATVAVSVRLLTGINGLAGVLVTSVFPRLARRGRDDSELAADDARVIVTGIKIVFVLAVSATAVVLAWPSFFVNLVLNATDRQAQAATLLMLSSSAAAGVSLFVAMLLIAKHRESAMLAVYGASTTVMFGGTIAVIGMSAGSKALLVAAALAAGQGTSALMFARRASLFLPSVRRAIGAGALGSVLFIGLGVIAALVPGLRDALAGVSFSAGLIVLVWILLNWHRGRRVAGDA